MTKLGKSPDQSAASVNGINVNADISEPIRHPEIFLFSRYFIYVILLNMYRSPWRKLSRSVLSLIFSPPSGVCEMTALQCRTSMVNFIPDFHQSRHRLTYAMQIYKYKFKSM